MRVIITLGILVTLFFVSCSKEEEVIIVEPPIALEQYEQFIGEYKVYDTIGNYMYDMNIVHHFSGNNIYGNDADSIILLNFADTFDVKYEYRKTTSRGHLDIGFHDSIVDQNNKSSGLWGLSEDLTTLVKENTLINDTIIMYFERNNIKYYIPEAQPYYYCKCKHVAVKQ